MNNISIIRIKSIFAFTQKVVHCMKYLLKHDLIRKIENKKKSEDAYYSGEFHAKKFFYMVVAYLGISDNDA